MPELHLDEWFTNSTASLEHSLAYATSKAPVGSNWVTFSIFLTTAVATILLSGLRPDTKIIMSTNDILAHATNVISLKTSMYLPVFGSVVLVGLYYLVKNGYINVFVWMSHYMTLNSFFTNISTLNYVFSLVNKLAGGRLFKNYQISLGPTDLPTGTLSEIEFKDLDIKNPENFLNYLKKNKFQVIQPSPITPKWSIILNAGSVVALLFSLVITYGYYSTASFIYSNVIAMNFMVFALTTIQIPSVKTATLLLSLFFLYDIYFVFGTDVMVTVAQSVDLPMKLLVPSLDDANKVKFSLLGLGDIILPGAYCLLCRQLGCDYFGVSLVAYILGLFASFVALNYYNVGQPALLYLVPSLIGSTSLYSIVKGEFSRFWNFDHSLADYDDDKVYGTDSEEEEEDEDYELDSYDEWEFKVEEIRDEITDIDDDPREGLEEMYNFIDDDDDQTFIIDNGDEEGEEDDDEEDVDLEEEEEAFTVRKEDLDQLIADTNEKVKYWFDD